MSIEQDLNRIATALEKLANVPRAAAAPEAPAPAPAPEAPAPAPAPEAPAPAPAPAPAATLTADELNNRLIAKYHELTGQGKDAESVMADIKAIIGADSIHQVDEAKYADIAQKVSAL